MMPPKWLRWVKMIGHAKPTEQPTVDAVQVVRCGECEHWDKWACDKDGGHECLYNGGVWMKDEFCSDGERKEKDK